VTKIRVGLQMDNECCKILQNINIFIFFSKVDVKTTLLSVDERINGVKKHSPAIIHTKMNVKLYSCYSLFVIRGVSKKKCKLRLFYRAF